MTRVETSLAHLHRGRLPQTHGDAIFLRVIAAVGPLPVILPASLHEVVVQLLLIPQNLIRMILVQNLTVMNGEGDVHSIGFLSQGVDGLLVLLGFFPLAVIPLEEGMAGEDGGECEYCGEFHDRIDWVRFVDCGFLFRVATSICLKCGCGGDDG